MELKPIFARVSHNLLRQEECVGGDAAGQHTRQCCAYKYSVAGFCEGIIIRRRNRKKDSFWRLLSELEAAAKHGRSRNNVIFVIFIAIIF